MMRPHDEADGADREHRKNHAEITEDRLLLKVAMTWLTMPKAGRIMM